MKVILYRFSKKVNSTAIPYSTVQRKTLDMQVYGDMSIIQPVLVCEGATGSSPFKDLSKYNYAFIDDFNRYYFVSNVTISNGQWVFSLSVDVLGTYRYSITSGTAFIERAETETATEKDDLHITGRITTVTNTGGDFFPVGVRYVVGIRGKNVSDYSLGSVNYYLMTHSQFASLSSYLWGAQITETQGVNAGDYITMCRPVCGTSYPVSQLQQVFIGNHQVTDLQACLLDVDSTHCYCETAMKQIAIPKHPMSTETNYHWLNDTPYATYTVNFGVFGTMNLPTSLLKDRAYLDFKVRVYPVTGDCTLFVYDANGGIVIRNTVNVFPAISLSCKTETLSTTAGNIANSFLDYVGEKSRGLNINVNQNKFDAVANSGFGQFMKNTFKMDISKIGQDISQIGSAISNGAGSQVANIGKTIVNQGINLGKVSVGGLPSISSSGGGGTMGCVLDAVSMTGYFSQVRDVVPAIEGRAINKSDTIGNYTGMVSLSACKIVPVGATETERNELYSLCNGVIYIE